MDLWLSYFAANQSNYEFYTMLRASGENCLIRCIVGVKVIVMLVFTVSVYSFIVSVTEL